MSVIEALSEEESYLAAIIQDISGVDLAEFCWVDEGSPDNLFRCYDYQYAWYRNDEKLQIDQCGRAIGKSVGIQLRSFAFAFNNPGQEMLITAPELVHLDPVTKYVEDRINEVRLSREMLYKKNGKTGFMHRPFEAKFINGSRIIGRIPQKDGKGVKGQHPRWLEMDEGQDYPQAGWVELTETLRFGDEGSRFRVHGVSRGIRDEYYKRTQSKDWYVHRITAMHRPDWTKEERISKAEIYGSRDHPDYRRNILGVHGDALSALFVLHRLMACVDDNENSDYNANEYYHVRINDEWLRDSGVPITELIQLPARHKDEHTKFWIGMDVGMTNHPSEILVLGERYRDLRKKDADDNRTNMRLRVIARIHLERISAMDQLLVMDHLAQFYRPAGFGMDRTGLGLPIYQIALEGDGVSPHLHRSIKGYNFSEKIPVGLRAEEEAEEGQLSLEERKITANVLEYSSDKLRELVDRQAMLLPWDIDMLKEFQGQAYYLRKDSTNPYGRKEFNRGKFHALDAARMAVLAYAQEHIQQIIEDSTYRRDETMILGIEEYEFEIY